MSESLVSEGLGATSHEVKAQPVFFAVSARKLVVLSICTLGIYQTYWMYRNWKLVRDQGSESLSPARRTVLAVFFAFPLFRRILRHQSAPDASRWAAGPIATGWIVLCLLGWLPAPYGLLTYFLAMFIVVPVQNAANTVNRALAPDHAPNARIAGLDWLVVVPGGLLLALGLVGSLLPPA
ncbi:DUF4234 domain-containing protein [Hydrogenophaga sp. RWCD_12]|uniref:DUF4234 domain-containing protein n=1 Tax=Hydrogenophaga sp. RWCD_12 TaxID=3391190 RepID=UPI0039846653